MSCKIISGHEYLVDLDRFTVRVRVLKRTARGWECETIPIGTRIIIGEDAFRGHPPNMSHQAGKPRQYPSE
jgi:hypothetical protein